jgi:hypothetical protein
MMPLQRSLGALLAILTTVALAWASRAPMTIHSSPDAMLRLAWSARPQRIEKCRQLSEEELAKIPQHMRQPVTCEGVNARYRLQVRVDGALVADRLVQGGGLRRDRRLYVFEEVPVAPREASIDVRLDRVDVEGAPTTEAKADRGEVPPHLAYTGRRQFLPRTVILVTYDPVQRVLTATTGSGADTSEEARR